MIFSILEIESLRVAHEMPIADLANAIGMRPATYKARLKTAKDGGKPRALAPKVVTAACDIFKLNGSGNGNYNDNDTDAGAGDDGARDIDAGVDEELEALEAENRRKAFGDDSVFIGMSRDELIAAAEALTPKQTADAGQIISAAAIAGLDDLEFTPIKVAIAKATGAGKRALDKGWKDALARAKKMNAEPVEDPEETRRRTEEERQAERDALWPEVKAIAEDPKLVEQYVARVQANGVVGEDKAIRANLIIYTSRLLSGTALGGLVVGPPASGKSFVAGMVLKLIPTDDVVELTGASAKALYFLGGAENATALKHKVLFLAEAAALSKQGGEEHELARILRMLIDGHASYSFTDFENKTSVKAEIEGPVAVLITSARDNVEAELKTRLLDRRSHR